MKPRITFIYFLLVVFAAGLFSTNAQEKKRVGVLPFLNKSAKKYNWISEGFATTLTEALSQIQSIYLVDRGLVNGVIKKGQYTADTLFTSQGAYEIGQKLNLDYVIIGAYRASKDNLDAILFLADAKKKGSYVKACSFNSVKPMSSMWQVYDELINSVCKTECFNVPISDDELKRIKAITENTQQVMAYEYYIKGRKEHLTFSVKGYEKAVKYYDSALTIDPKYSLAMGAKGEALAFWGYQKELNGEEYKSMYDNAYDNVQKALRISSNIGALHRNMATTYQMLRKFDEANTSAKRAIDLNNNDAEAWYMYWRSGPNWENPQANEIIRALEISPYLPVAHLTLGNHYYNIKDYPTAEDHYKKALVGNNEYELAHANLGNMYGLLKRYDEAIASFNRAIEIKPQYEFAWSGLGWVYELQAEEFKKAGDVTNANIKYNEALSAYQKAAEINPKKAANFYSIGLMYWRLENWQGVVDAWEKCLKLDPNHESANQWLPKAKEKLKGK